MSSVALTILNLIALWALLWFFDSAYREYRIDLLRFELFGVRDRLFDAARDGAIPFNHSAYTTTRQMLNGMIRFGHDLGLWKLMFLFLTKSAWSNSNEDQRFFDRFDEEIRSLSPEGRAAITKALADAHGIVLLHMLHTSLLTFPLLMFLKCFLFLRRRMAAGASLVSTRFASRAIRLIDRGAYIFGGT